MLVGGTHTVENSTATKYLTIPSPPPHFLPSRLVGGLASEKVRWAESVEKFKQDEKTLAGDVLLTTSYLSYVGCFGRSYRTDMLFNKWMPFLTSLEVGSSVYRNIEALKQLLIIVANQLKSKMSYWCSLVPRLSPPQHFCRGLSLKMRLLLVLRAVQYVTAL